MMTVRSHGRFKVAERCRDVAFAAALFFTMIACAGPPADLGPAPPPTESMYRLGPGDQVRIGIFQEPTLSGEYSIDGNGTLTLPLIGVVNAGGMTPDQLTATLSKKYAEYLRNPNVSLEILKYRPFYIVGEVQKPGDYPYQSGMTVINAIAIAGGFTYRANADNFYIQRKAALEDKNVTFGAQPTTEVRPGDVIVVRERFF